MKRESLTTPTCRRLTNSCSRRTGERGRRRKITSQGTGCTQVSRVEIKRVQANFNDRPRKVLNWHSPVHVFITCCARILNAHCRYLKTQVGGSIPLASSTQCLSLTRSPLNGSGRRDKPPSLNVAPVVLRRIIVQDEYRQWFFLFYTCKNQKPVGCLTAIEYLPTVALHYIRLVLGSARMVRFS